MMRVQPNNRQVAKFHIVSCVGHTSALLQVESEIDEKKLYSTVKNPSYHSFVNINVSLALIGIDDVNVLEVDKCLDYCKMLQKMY